MTPSTFYGNDLETLYVNQHGVPFVIASPDFVRADQFERVDEIPDNAKPLNAQQISNADITLPAGIEEVAQ